LKLYEGMFILDDARCAEDYNGTVATVHDILTQQGAEIVDSRKWEERKLAYPIRKHQRGVYALIHFNAPPDAISRIERQIRLASDVVLRALIVVDEDGISLGAEKEAEKEAREARKAEATARESEEKAEEAEPLLGEAAAAVDDTKTAQEAKADESSPAEEPPARADAPRAKDSKDKAVSEEEPGERLWEPGEHETEEDTQEGP